MTGSRLGREELPAVRARDLEPVQDVGLGLFRRQRREVEAQADALHQLDQLRRVELLVELGLPGQDDPEHLLLRRLDAGEHPDLLEHAVREVLRLVHDQEDLASGRVLLDEELVQRRDQLGLAHLERREAELDQHGLEELDRGDLGLRDLRDDDVLLELAQEGLEERRLAGTDLARDHDEAVGEPDRRLHVRLGARMVLGQVEERRIRAEPERQLIQLEVFQVHGVLQASTAQVPVPLRESTGVAVGARHAPGPPCSP